MRASQAAISSLLVCLMSTLAAGHGVIIVRPPVELPRPVPAPPAASSNFLECRQLHAEVTVRDQVVITQIEQTFYNAHAARLEGHFIYPLPQDAQIDEFEMEIDGELMPAELLDAPKARKIYEDIVRSMRDPALMEYAGRGMLRVRVFPIEPHATKRVKLTYTQVAARDGGLMGCHLPLKAAGSAASMIAEVSLRIDLTSKHPIKSIYSPTHNVEIRRKGDRGAVVGFEASNHRSNADFQLFTSVSETDLIGVDLLTYRAQDEDDGTFLLLLNPGLNVDATQVVSKDIVFVVDTSGSMTGGKLDQARRALRFCVENLNRDDRFQIIRFSTDAEALFEGLVPFDDRSRRKADDFIEAMRPMGGTNIEEALQLALAPTKEKVGDRPCVVIFLTDGRPTVGSRDNDALVRISAGAADAGSARVFCFGIGTAVNTHLLDRITEKTRAVSQYVLPDEDIEVKVSSFYGKIRSPVLTRAVLTVEGPVRLSKMYPAPLPDLFKGDQLVLLGRFQGGGEAALRLSGMVHGEKKTFTYEAVFSRPGVRTGHDFIGRLWATRRVGHLLDEIRLHGDEKELRDEVSRLAHRYGIVTPYTSYLILENEQRGGRRMSSMAPLQRTLHSLRRLETGDTGKSFQREFDTMRLDTTGDLAVAGARANRKMKEASTSDDFASVASGPTLSIRGGAVGSTVAAATQTAATSQPVVRYVEGKTFYRDGERWIDAQVEVGAEAKAVKIKFASDEYFKLLRDRPQAKAWLSLGRSVVVLIEGKVCRIVDED